MRSVDILVLCGAFICIVVLLNLESAVTFRKRFTIDFHGSDAIPHLPPQVLPSFPSWIEKDNTVHKHLLYVKRGNTIVLHTLRPLSHTQKWYFGGQGEVNMDRSTVVLEYEMPSGLDLIQAIHYVPETVQFFVLTRKWKVLCFNYTRAPKTRVATLKLTYQTDLRNPILLDSSAATSSSGETMTRPLRRIISSKISSSSTKLGIHTGDEGIITIAVESDHHNYHYYGLHMKDGKVRWSHEPEDYHYPRRTDVQGLHQSSFRFLHQNFDDVHYGEVNWRIYETDILRQLPHRYRHEHDLSINLDHFIPEKSSKNRKIKKTSAKSKKSKSQDDKKDSKDATSSSTWDDPTDTQPKQKKQSPRNMPITEEEWYSNVMVVHHQKGIEVLHLYTGRTITTLGPLNHDVLYDDINSDGVIESSQIRLHDRMDGTQCLPHILAGIPTSKERLGFDPDDEASFSLCAPTSAIKSLMSLEVLVHQFDMNNFFHNVPPTVIPSTSPILHSHSRSVGIPLDEEDPANVALPLGMKKRKRVQSLSKQVIYYMNNGMITSLSVESNEYMHQNWQVLVPSHYTHNGGHFFEIAAFPLHTSPDVHEQQQEYIVVSGHKSMTVLDSRSGQVLDTIMLDVSPHAPLVFEDLTGNGRNDILLVNAESLVGIVTHVSYSGNSAITVFLLGFVVFIVSMYLSTFVQLTNPLYYQKKK